MRRAASSALKRSRKRSATGSATMKRLAAMQLCPLLTRRPSAAARAVLARSASASTMKASLPPSSRTCFFRARPAWAATEEGLEATQADADAAAKRFWQRSSWYRRASIRNESLAGQPVIDDLPTQGAIVTDEIMEAAAAGDLIARRRMEDERYAYFAEASIVFLDQPDAIFRGYETEAELLGTPREDDVRVGDLLRREIERLEPQQVYLPLGVGGHVDHQLCRQVGIDLLGLGTRWVMPGPEYAGTVVFYEDFPYALWNDFRSLDQLGADAFAALPGNVSIFPTFADISDQIERKITGITIYESQIERLFDSPRQMGDAVRSYGAALGVVGDIAGPAERYWRTSRV